MFKICYWDADAQEQRERNSTPEEDVQYAADIAAARAEAQRATTPPVHTT